MTLNYDLTHDLDPWFSRSSFEKVVTQEWDARSTWNERDVSRLNVGPMLWLSTFTSPMTLTLDFQGQVLKVVTQELDAQLHEPRIFYPSGHWPETVTNAHVCAHFRWSLGASVISTHIRTEGLYVKTHNNLSIKTTVRPRLCIHGKHVYKFRPYKSVWFISHAEHFIPN